MKRARMGRTESDEQLNRGAAGAQIAMPFVLDACCGPRMFWFNREDPRALFIDKRAGVYARDLGTKKTKGRRPIVVAPDVLADFTTMPFADESFYLVVFDPPHLTASRVGNHKNSIMANSYGVLSKTWPRELEQGFTECFRVLKPGGTLVFKWAETCISVAAVLRAALPMLPLFGNRSGKATHWYVFMKPAERDSASAREILPPSVKS